MSSKKNLDIAKKSDFFITELEKFHMSEMTRQTEEMLMWGSKEVQGDGLITFIAKEYWREETRKLKDDKIISEEQYATLLAMVNSPDCESYDLAKTLITFKLEDNGYTIRSGRT